MALVNGYAPGAPCWFELGTTDHAAAKQFYTQLFGWAAADMPAGPDQMYTLFRLKDRDVGGAYVLAPKMTAAGVPPHWAVYFATSDVDASAAKVSALGGSVLEKPFDVMDVGRMAVCKDPGDAVFSLWQPKKHQGAGIFGEDNAVCWAELATRDIDKVRPFYTGLFGWQAAGSDNMPTYIEFSVEGQPRGGMMPMDEQWKGVPPHWGIYFMVADVDATIARAKELGGSTCWGPHDAPGVGRMAGLTDPQGAGFSIIKLAHPM